MKSGTLRQREMGIIKSGGAAAARIGKYKKWGRCRNEKWAVKKAGELPQRELGSIKSGVAAATRTGQKKKRGGCRSKKWVVKMEQMPQR